jgi:hypothetical protein
VSGINGDVLLLVETRAGLRLGGRVVLDKGLLALEAWLDGKEPDALSTVELDRLLRQSQDDGIHDEDDARGNERDLQGRVTGSEACVRWR